MLLQGERLGGFADVLYCSFAGGDYRTDALHALSARQWENLLTSDENYCALIVVAIIAFGLLVAIAFAVLT